MGCYKNSAKRKYIAVDTFVKISYQKSSFEPWGIKEKTVESQKQRTS